MIRKFLELVKFEHTLFALPFAYTGMILAAGRLPSGWHVFWITLAMVGARTAAMTLNRLIDRPIDAKNPRTKLRPSVTGEFPVVWAWSAAGVSIAVFLFAAWRLNPLCFKLSPVALIFLCGYHYVKRFSWVCHFVLGFTLAMAPVGGWIAVTGEWSWAAALLGLAVCAWVAGFDILYALQDADFDRENKLHSIPVRFGEAEALRISSGCHVATASFLVLLGLAMGLGGPYWTGIAIVCALLWVEHYLLSDGDLSRIDTAFFAINGWIGILLLIFTFLEIFR